MPDIVIHVVSERPGKPPLVRLLVDVRVTNPARDSKWLLIASRVPSSGGGGVDKLEQFAAGPVKFGRFLGTGGFYALALAPNATLTLKNLEVGWWNSSAAAAPPPIEVRTATGVTLDGETIASWFHGDPMMRGTIAADAATATPTHSRRADRELAVTLTDGVTTNVTMHSVDASAAFDPPEWRSGFPVPKGAREDLARSGATSLGPGKNHVIEAFEIDAGFEVVATFFARHLPDAQRAVDGDAVRFTKVGGTVELRRAGEKSKFTIRTGPF